MQRLRKIAVLICTALAVPQTDKGAPLQAHPIHLELSQVGHAYPGAQMLRAVQHNGERLIVISHTTAGADQSSHTTFAALSLRTQADSWREVQSIQQLLPVAPRWDAAYNSAGHLQIVYEEAGGALNQLWLQADSGRAKLTDVSSLRSYSLPRFIKSSGKPSPGVTTVADDRLCMALSLTGAQTHALRECMDGLLVASPTGYVLLTKTFVPGLPRAVNISPGHLQATLMTRDFQPLGLPVDVAGETVFQFDAEIVEGKLVCAATTPEGLVVASSALSALRFSHQGSLASTTLTYPAILSSMPGKVDVFALESGGSEKAHAEVAHLAVP